MKMTGKSLRFSELPKDYSALCSQYLPRPIHDEIGYENALEVAEAMDGFEERFSRDQGDYFVLVTDLILAYEEETRDRSLEKNLTLRQRLQHLLRSAEWSASDLGRFGRRCHDGKQDPARGAETDRRPYPQAQPAFLVERGLLPVGLRTSAFLRLEVEAERSGLEKPSAGARRRGQI